mgnify:CR=1 FL=1
MQRLPAELPANPGQEAGEGEEQVQGVAIDFRAWEHHRSLRLARLKFLECYAEQQSGLPVTPSLSQESFERRQVLKRTQHQQAVARLTHTADILQFGLARLRGDTAHWFAAAITEIVNDTGRLHFQQPVGPAPAAPAADPHNPDPPAEFPNHPSEPSADSEAEESQQQPRVFGGLKRAHTCIDLTEE